MPRLVLVGVLLLALLAALIWRFVPAREAAAPSDERPAREAVTSPATLPEYWDVPEFTFVDQNERRVGPNELRGAVWIANFIFTQCTSICPTMSAKMVRLQRSLAAPELRFVSFSVDPKHDTPAVLAGYAERWSPGETRWVLLATDDAGLERTARAIGVTVEASDDVENPILHSNRFFLIDPRGVVRGLYNSEDDEAMERLASEAQALLAVEFPASRSERAGLDGAGLFHAYGCAACHSDARLAPSLAGLFGRQVAQDGGSSRVVDEAYLREAILDPAAWVVAGYRPTMPTYRGTLADAELDRLVMYLRTLIASIDAQHSEAPIDSQDPVCKMHVTAVADTPSYEHGGVRYNFCSEDCLLAFQANPTRFVDE